MNIWLASENMMGTPAPGSEPGANRTPFRIHSNADNVRVQDPGLGLERNSVMAETTAFVLLGVKASAVLAPLRQNQV
ncbi:Mannosyl-Oligosaccharide 1,2-Alpha-Mannosidase Ic [Manis pentadactyla]|nr:Mannosyl-Oligosaccharide 1,2-Alpha-Mannosidase Ic [Manis pentadactyla]